MSAHRSFFKPAVTLVVAGAAGIAAVMLWPKPAVTAPNASLRDLPVAVVQPVPAASQDRKVYGKDQQVGASSSIVPPPVQQPAALPPLPQLQPGKIAHMAVPKKKTAVAAPATPANDAPPLASHTNVRTERQMRVQELLAEVAAEKDPHIAQRTQLTIAGYYAGDGDWAAALKIYEDLLSSPYVEVRQAVQRNLEVTRRNLALEAETDDNRREWLRLDLAALHESYGHEKAAKTMLRSLQAGAAQDAVRQQAAQRLATYVTAPLPTLPPANAAQGGEQ